MKIRYIIDDRERLIEYNKSLLFREQLLLYQCHEADSIILQCDSINLSHSRLLAYTDSLYRKYYESWRESDKLVDRCKHRNKLLLVTSIVTTAISILSILLIIH